MKSTGEVMGVGETFAEAFVKSQLAAGVRLPKGGKAFLSVRNADKARAIEVGRALDDLGFALVATKGTAAALEKAGLKVQPVNKVMEGRPHIVDMLKNREVTSSSTPSRKTGARSRIPGRFATPPCRIGSRTTRRLPAHARLASA
jgi:carbamoyl-phosphate synthase large subunit